MKPIYPKTPLTLNSELCNPAPSLTPRNDINTLSQKRQLYVQWDRGSPPDLITLVELAELLDITIDYLVGREN